ncbi:MAG TPA: four helix bundle protein, partial [Thermodesulfobacteriota bacterium]|nr:four helix bundle protein [Thermodesulfobacteriota bacterium]
MSERDKHARPRDEDESLIPKHGGYRRLKTFQLAEIVYDVTVRFCEKYIDPRSRTVDQMVQAARSGRQNIAEGSMDSATSKKIELKLTGVARGSLEELRLDYEDYLRQRGFPLWPPDYPALMRFKERRCSTLEEFRSWAADEVRREKKDTERRNREGQNTDGHGLAQTGKN